MMLPLRIISPFAAVAGVFGLMVARFWSSSRSGLCRRRISGSGLPLVVRALTYGERCRCSAARSLSGGRNPTASDVERQIKEITALTTDHLTPEIKLHLITPDCALWTADPSLCPLPEPYWAFYWPGGQALSRYILDHPELFAGRLVIDVGCGCGSSAIAAARVGASQVIANDVDKVALVAARLNADANEVTLTSYSDDNYIESSDSCGPPSVATRAWPSAPSDGAVLLLGDMLYSDEFADMAFRWALGLAGQGWHVYIGDPGRQYVRRLPLFAARTVAAYSLPASCAAANSGFTEAVVLRLMPAAATTAALHYAASAAEP